MEFVYKEDIGKTQCVAYAGDDVCCECPSLIRNCCPLLVAIANNYVYPSASELNMKSCSLLTLLEKCGLRDEDEEIDEEESDEE